MQDLQYSIFNLVLVIAAALFFHNAFVLLVKGKNNRPQKVLGVVNIIWGILYLGVRFACYKGLVHFPVFGGESLLSTTIFICMMFLYPLEILIPGWVNTKRILIMLTPLAFLSFFYYIGLQITGEHMEDFHSFNELLAEISKFNVWYRFIILACNLLLILALLKFLSQGQSKYLQWQDENFSDQENVDISWMNSYKKIMIAITVGYLLIIVVESVWSIILHTIIVICGFSILYYKALFHENSYQEYYSENFKGKHTNIQGKSTILEPDEQHVINDNSFESKLPEYVEKLREWMDSEKPFLYKEFKLADVGRVLPLNRSYLSRVFNEGFQHNFSEVVREYRIEHAKSILKEQPEITLYKVAELCGFSSDTTFIKAFQKVTGVTPKQFKMQV